MNPRALVLVAAAAMIGVLVGAALVVVVARVGPLASHPVAQQSPVGLTPAPPDTICHAHADACCGCPRGPGLHSDTGAYAYTGSGTRQLVGMRHQRQRQRGDRFAAPRSRPI